MQIINDMQKKVQTFATDNASTLLTAGGVVGTVATAVLAGRAGYKAHEIIAEKETEQLVGVPVEEQGDIERENVKLSKWEKVGAVGVHFVPPLFVGSLTIGSIVMANRMSAQKAAALAAAYGLTQKQFDEYREKVTERLGGPKKDRPDADDLNAEMAQDRANRAPRPGTTIIVSGDNVLCFDEAGGRFFQSNMEKLKRAENKVNNEILTCNPVSLNEFYDQVGLPPTSYGDQVGFNQDHLLELDIKAIMNPEDESTPMLAIDFNGGPVVNYTKHHQ